ncbi:oxygenase MpaB family protein [Nocardia sp. NPDC056100]
MTCPINSQVHIPVTARSEARPIRPFGPGTHLWEWGGDMRVWLIYGAAAFVLQGTHPIVAKGVFDHSTVFTDPYGRGIRSFEATQRWIYGGEQAYDEARKLRDIHRTIQGSDYEGKRYHALNAEPYAWVWATGWFTFLPAVRSFSREPVTRETERQLYTEMQDLGRILGVAERMIPDTLEDFEAYLAGMLEQLRAGHPDMAAGLEVFSVIPAPPYVPRALWSPVGRVAGGFALFVIAAYGPPLLRDLLGEYAGYTWTRRRQWKADALVRSVQIVGPFIPERLRYVPSTYRARRRARRTPSLTMVR